MVKILFLGFQFPLVQEYTNLQWYMCLLNRKDWPFFFARKRSNVNFSTPKNKIKGVVCCCSVPYHVYLKNNLFQVFNIERERKAKSNLSMLSHVAGHLTVLMEVHNYKDHSFRWTPKQFGGANLHPVLHFCHSFKRVYKVCMLGCIWNIYLAWGIISLCCCGCQFFSHFPEHKSRIPWQ